MALDSMTRRTAQISLAQSDSIFVSSPRCFPLPESSRDHRHSHRCDNFFTTVTSQQLSCSVIRLSNAITSMVESKTHGSGGGAPVSSDTLEQAALKVLQEGDPWRKAQYGDLAATLWLEGTMRIPYEAEGPLLVVPSRPARLDIVRLVAPRDMPKLGRGGSLQSRQALVHSLVHTESWAIDLSWDIIARFGKAEAMPREFFDDFVRVAQDEGRHFRLLAARLTELNSSYGALPAHDGLWDSAEATAHDLKARLAVEHCVHEARGLDVLPTTVGRFRRGGDEVTAKLLESVIYPEEITHCAAGVKWFSFLCLREKAKTHDGASVPVEDIARKLSLSEAAKKKTSTSSQEPNNGAREMKSEDVDGSCEKELPSENGERTSQTGESTSKNGQSASQNGDNGGLTSENGESASQSEESTCKNGESVSENGDLASENGESTSEVVAAFHDVVRKYFRGPLKPPFNDAARAAAGFGPEWYLPLAFKAPVELR